MTRWIAAVLFAGCLVVSVWAQAAQGQDVPEQAPAEQKATDQSHPAEAGASNPSAPATESKESVLEKFQNFSAISNGGPLPGMDVDRYIYRSGHLVRMQGDAAIPDYEVTDLVSKKTHAVSARACFLMDFPYKGSFPWIIPGPGVTYEHTPVGEDTVDGHHVHVEDILIHNPKNPAAMNFRLYEADDLKGFPIKIENRRKPAYPWVIHYKDVKVGAQDPSLFIFPEKCDTMAGFASRGGKAPAKKSAGKSAPATNSAPAAKPQ